MQKSNSISDDNLILVDWLTVTTIAWDVEDLILAFGLYDINPWEERDCFRYGYRHCRTYGGISFLTDGHKESMGVCIEFSGQGCRTFEDYSNLSWYEFFAFLMDDFNDFRITHIDLAFDDHTGILDMNQLLEDTDNRHYRSRSRWWKVEYGSCGSTIYHGSPQSQIRVRIYDKAAERGLLDGTHWVRVEVVLRRENATGAIAAILEKQDIGGVFSGVLSNYLVYCDPSSDSNRSRWQPTEYWQALLDSAAPIHIASKPGSEYNVFRLQHYLVDQAGGAIFTWMQIYGLDDLEDLIKKRNKPLNPNHLALIRENERLKKNGGIPDEV